MGSIGRLPGCRFGLPLSVDLLVQFTASKQLDRLDAVVGKMRGGFFDFPILKCKSRHCRNRVAKEKHFGEA
jgi:hypothetical protein